MVHQQIFSIISITTDSSYCMLNFLSLSFCLYLSLCRLPKLLLLLIFVERFSRLKSDVHMTTGKDPGSINHCTCNIYITFKQIVSISDSRLYFRSGNESALLTIYHYKVNFLEKCVKFPSSSKIIHQMLVLHISCNS